MTVDQTPLRGFADRFVQASQTGGKIALREESLLQQVNLRIDPAATGSLGDVLGGPLPLDPNTVTTTNRGQIVWLGPDEWLVLGSDREADLESEVRAAVSVPLSVVDVSASRTVISLSGPAARDVLAHGCGLDLDPSRFPTGTCAQTRIALADVILIAPSDQLGDFVEAPTFLILVRASFAPYLASWLLDAATEYRTDAGPVAS